MQFLYLLKVETKRIFCSKITYLFIALCSIAPLFGYSLFSVLYGSTKTVMYIGDPMLVGGVIGAVLFAIFTLYELSKVDKNEISALSDSIISPLTMGVCKTYAIIFVPIVTTIVIMLTQLPYILIKTEEFFNVDAFLTLSVWGLGVNLCFGVLFASSLYHFFKRVDLSFISFILLLIISNNQFIKNLFMLRWATPAIMTFSDVYGNDHIFRFIIYIKLFWILIFGALWIVSILCIRRYGKGLVKSFGGNSKKNIASLVLSVVMFGSGIAMYVHQPFFDHTGGKPGDMEAYLDEYERNNSVVLYSQSVDTHFDTKKGTQFSKATYTIKNIANEDQIIAIATNPGFKIKSATLCNVDLPYTKRNKEEAGFQISEITIPKGQKGDLVIHYEGYQQEQKYWTRMGLVGRAYICDEYISVGWDLNVMPSLFVATSKEDLQTSVMMTLPDYMTLLTTSKAPEIISKNSDGTNTWYVHDYEIMYAGDFTVQTFEYDDMDLEFYYSAQYEEMIRESGTIQMIEDVLDYCTKAFGSMNLEDNLPFKLVQSSEHEGGGRALPSFAYSLESAYVAENLDDPLKGANAADVLAHEIIHQWWGIRFGFSAGTYGKWSLDAPDEKEWSSEGMTVYTTYRVMKHLKGEEYAQKYYVDVWKEHHDNMQRSFYIQNPQYLDILPAKYRASILGELELTERYCIMPLKLLKAEQLLGGEQAFDKAVMNIFAPTAGTGEPVSYEQFLTGLGLTEEDLSLD